MNLNISCLSNSQIPIPLLYAFRLQRASHILPAWIVLAIEPQQTINNQFGNWRRTKKRVYLIFLGLVKWEAEMFWNHQNQLTDVGTWRPKNGSLPKITYTLVHSWKLQKHELQSKERPLVFAQNATLTRIFKWRSSNQRIPHPNCLHASSSSSSINFWERDSLVPLNLA